MYTTPPKPLQLPISRGIVVSYVLSEVKLTWFIDLLNINLNNQEGCDD